MIQFNGDDATHVCRSVYTNEYTNPSYDVFFFVFSFGTKSVPTNERTIWITSQSHKNLINVLKSVYWIRSRFLFKV